MIRRDRYKAVQYGQRRYDGPRGRNRLTYTFKLMGFYGSFSIIGLMLYSTMGNRSLNFTYYSNSWVYSWDLGSLQNPTLQNDSTPKLKADRTPMPSSPTINHTKHVIVMFTTFKNSADKMHIYQNTIRNWALLQPHVKPVLYYILGELDLRLFAEKNHWDCYPVPSTSAEGVPVLKSMFLHAETIYKSQFFAYANGDILFDYSLIDTLKSLEDYKDKIKQVLIVGRRTNVQVREHQEIKTLEEVTALGKQGELFSVNAEDYFITPTGGFPWNSIPDFVVGRPGYDNWLVVTALVKRMAVVDTTKTILALHQTGKDGNKAGFNDTKDATTNYSLAGRHFDYSLGVVTCGQLVTEVEWGNVVVKERKIIDCPKRHLRIIRKIHI